MVLGCLWGPTHFAVTLWWMIVVGGALAVAFIVLRGGAGDLLRRWYLSAKLTLLSRTPTYVQPAPGSPARAGVPFAVAMTLGAAAYQMWGSPWA